jgi:hypothetical protein
MSYVQARTESGQCIQVLKGLQEAAPMTGRFSKWAVAAALAGVAAILVQTPAQAGDSAGYVPGLPSTQVMLYLSWPVGARGLSASSFGLRYDRASAARIESTAPFPLALRHRSLVQLEFSRGTAPRVLFDTRVTWDLGRGQLGPSRLVNAVWRLPQNRIGAASSAPELP